MASEARHTASRTENRFALATSLHVMCIRSSLHVHPLQSHVCAQMLSVPARSTLRVCPHKAQKERVSSSMLFFFLHGVAPLRGLGRDFR